MAMSVADCMAPPTGESQCLLPVWAIALGSPEPELDSTLRLQEDLEVLKRKEEIVSRGPPTPSVGCSESWNLFAPSCPFLFHSCVNLPHSLPRERSKGTDAKLPLDLLTSPVWIQTGPSLCAQEEALSAKVSMTERVVLNTLSSLVSSVSWFSHM